jgi:NAD(P)-dependent dehydrogenase (short-subunit alcohol dehydrogenase family)
MELGLEGARVVVTGGTKGMGRATAELMAEEGASVAVFARGKEALDETESRLRELGSPDPVGLAVDVGQPQQIADAFAILEKRWGSLNSLVNTVGPFDGLFESLSDEDWDSAFELGTMSMVRCVREALPLLRRAEWARIVNFAAHSIKRQSPRLVAYTASKAALVSITKNLAKSLGPEGILVNAVSPGTFVTDSFTNKLRPLIEAEGLDPADPVDVMTWIERTFHHPADLGRAGLPEEIASITTYLASRRNGYVTGANINVDGGSDFA